MQIDIGNRKIDTSDVVEASIDMQKIKLKNGEMIRIGEPLFSTIIAICCKEYAGKERADNVRI